MTKAEALKITCDLFTWLSKNPGKRKSDWPEYHRVADCKSDCALCAWVHEHFPRKDGNNPTGMLSESGTNCGQCPLITIWPQGCITKPSPYVTWTDNKGYSVGSEAAAVIASEAFRQYLEMPLPDNKPKEPKSEEMTKWPMPYPDSWYKQHQVERTGEFRVALAGELFEQITAGGDSCSPTVVPGKGPATLPTYGGKRWILKAIEKKEDPRPPRYPDAWYRQYGVKKTNIFREPMAGDLYEPLYDTGLPADWREPEVGASAVRKWYEGKRWILAKLDAAGTLSLLDHKLYTTVTNLFNHRRNPSEIEWELAVSGSNEDRLRKLCVSVGWIPEQHPYRLTWETTTSDGQYYMARFTKCPTAESVSGIYTATNGVKINRMKHPAYVWRTPGNVRELYIPGADKTLDDIPFVVPRSHRSDLDQAMLEYNQRLSPDLDVVLDKEFTTEVATALRNYLKTLDVVSKKR